MVGLNLKLDYFISLVKSACWISKLNIVKNIVELHKGTIAASNRLNTKGAQVEVLLPKFS